MKCETLIVGAGLTGLSTAFHLEQAGQTHYLLVEAQPTSGGWAQTDWLDGFGFDRGIHVLYFRDEPTRALVEKLLDGQWQQHTRVAVVDSGGVRTAFPYHAHLHGRSPEVVEECLSGLRRAATVTEERPPTNFEEWIIRQQGDGVLRHFMEPYNTKLWTVSPAAMEAGWMGTFVPNIALDEALAGAKTTNRSQLGRNGTFHYPIGGIGRLPAALAERVPRLRLSTRLVGLDLRSRTASLSDGSQVRYRQLLTTMDLRRLTGLVELPAPLQEARQFLQVVDLLLVDLGIKEPVDSEVHWAYLPDAEVLPYRLHQGHVLSAGLAPPGHGTLCLEISHSPQRPLPPGPLRERVVQSLVDNDWLRSAGDVVAYRERRLPGSYSIPLLGSTEAAEALGGWLREQGVWSTGRYGRWRYANMEDALLDGRTAAEGLCGGAIA